MTLSSGRVFAALAAVTLLNSASREAIAQTASPHPNVVRAGDNLRPAPGYAWVSDAAGDYRVRWVPGAAHPSMPNVVAASTERSWAPARGWRWLTRRPGDMRVIPGDRMNLEEVEERVNALRRERQFQAAQIEGLRGQVAYWDEQAAKDRAGGGFGTQATISSQMALGTLQGKQGRIRNIDAELGQLEAALAGLR